MDIKHRDLISGAALQIRFAWCNTEEADDDHNVRQTRWKLIRSAVDPVVGEKLTDYFCEYYAFRRIWTQSREADVQLRPMDAFAQAMPAARANAQINPEKDPDLCEDFRLVCSCLVHLHDGEFSDSCMPPVVTACDDDESSLAGGRTP